MSGPPSITLSASDVPALSAVTKRPIERRAGLRLAYMIRQFQEWGWTIQRLGETLDVDPSLLSKWSNPEKVKRGLAERAGLRDSLFQSVVTNLRLSSDYFFVADAPLKQQSPRARVVQLPEGKTRDADDGELDCRMFSFEKEADRIDKAARQMLLNVDQRSLETERTVRALQEDVARITRLLDQLVGQRASNR